MGQWGGGRIGRIVVLLRPDEASKFYGGLIKEASVFTKGN